MLTDEVNNKHTNRFFIIGYVKKVSVTYIFKPDVLMNNELKEAGWDLQLVYKGYLVS